MSVQLSPPPVITDRDRFRFWSKVEDGHSLTEMLAMVKID